MARVRTLQTFEVLLVVSLLFGFAMYARDPEWPDFVGIFVNIFLQYATLKAIRRQKEIAQLAPTEQAEIVAQQRAILKPLLIAGFFLAVVLMIDIGLFLSHVYSIRICMFVAIAAGVLPFWFLVFRIARLQKRQV